MNEGHYTDEPISELSATINDDIICGQLGRHLKEEEALASIDAEVWLDYTVYKHYKDSSEEGESPND